MYSRIHPASFSSEGRPFRSSMRTSWNRLRNPTDVAKAAAGPGYPRFAANATTTPALRAQSQGIPSSINSLSC
jgi:hypothetical protein